MKRPAGEISGMASLGDKQKTGELHKQAESRDKNTNHTNVFQGRTWKGSSVSDHKFPSIFRGGWAASQT